MTVNIKVVSVWLSLVHVVWGTDFASDTEECRAGDCLNFLQTPIKAHEVHLADDLEADSMVESFDAEKQTREAAFLQEMRAGLNNLDVDAFADSVTRSMERVVNEKDVEGFDPKTLAKMKQDLGDSKTRAAVIKYVKGLQVANSEGPDASVLLQRGREDMNRKSTRKVWRRLKPKWVPETVALANMTNASTMQIWKWTMTGTGVFTGLVETARALYYHNFMVKAANEHETKVDGMMKDNLYLIWKFMSWESIAGGYLMGCLFQLMNAFGMHKRTGGLIVAFFLEHLWGMYSMFSFTADNMGINKEHVVSHITQEDTRHLSNLILHVEEGEAVGALFGMLMGWGGAMTEEYLENDAKLRANSSKATKK